MSQRPEPHNGVRLERRDVAEIVVGSCVLGFPMAATEEIWELGETLPAMSMLPVVASSVFFLGAFVYFLHYEGRVRGGRAQFVGRVLLTYGVTLVCCAMVLALIDKLPILSEPIIALKRVLLVAFPASFAATVVDSLR